MLLEQLTIQRWAHGGDGVGVPEAGPLAGAVVFVPRAVPGDVVACRIVKRKKRWARAELVRLVRPSPHRQVPACALQDRCGGCPWMAGDHTAQADSRLAILRGEAHKRLGLDPARVSLAADDGPPLGYRSRVRMAWEVGTHQRVSLGYRAAGSHQLVDAQTCVVASDAIQAELPQVRRRLAARGPGRGEVTLLSGPEGVAGLLQPNDGAAVPFGPAQVTVGTGPHAIVASPETFVQANPVVTAAIAARIEALARASGASHAVELFAGSGALTLPLLDAGLRVTAYEVSGAARAGFDANTAGRGEATWHPCDLMAIGVPLPDPAAPDLILLDPPRTGAAEVMPWVRGSRAHTVLLVSCDVSTAMRDLETLVVGGAWEVRSITGYDMFPHTGHQELLAHVTRTSAPAGPAQSEQ